MKQRSPGLTWLDRKDPKQQIWAHEYLQKKGQIDQQYRSSTSDQLLQIGEKLERSREGILILGQMNNAWRQTKCTVSDRNKDRKAYAFKLNIEVKKDLTWLAKRNKVTAAEMLSRLISGELDAHVRFETTLNEEKKAHKELLRNSRNNTAQYKESNRTLRELLEVSIARLCRSEILLEDAALSTESFTEDQQRRIDKRCRQIMAEVEAVVKGQSALLQSELFNHAIPVGDSTLALKEAAAESPTCSNNSPAGNQSSSTEPTFRIDSERLPLPEGHSKPSLVLEAEPHGPGTNNHTGLRPTKLPEEKNSASLEKNSTGLESRSAPQRPPDGAATDVASRSNKITLQRKKHSVIRGPQGKLEED